MRLLSLCAADAIAFGLATGFALVLVAALSAANFGGIPYTEAHLWPKWQDCETLLVLIGLLVLFAGKGSYTGRVPLWTDLRTILSGIAIALLVDQSVIPATPDVPVRLEGALRWLFYAPSLLLTRHVAKAGLESAGLWTLDILLIGERSAIDRAEVALLAEPELGYRIVGTAELQSLPQSNPVRRLNELMARYDAEFVLMVVGDGEPGIERRIIAALTQMERPFAVITAFDDLPVLGFRSDYLLSRDLMLVTYRNGLTKPLSRFVKMLLDVVVSSLLLVLCLPVFLLIALLVRLDGGPAFFRHTRIGANGQRFHCLKFRTMSTDADQLLERLLAADQVARKEWEETHKLRRDPRVTPTGRFLRRTSLDELPQLINVLRGEMSLVGPRPIVDAEVERYGSNVNYYFKARPGMTGLWQVSGRSGTTYERRVQLDVWYVRNWVLWHDIVILLKTIPAVFMRKGAT